MTEPRIITNAAKCLKCGDTVESKHRHNPRSCGCGNLIVDGGHYYLRRLIHDHDTVEEASLFESTAEEIA